MILTKKEITLVEEYNGTVRALFMDPWYTQLLKQYIALLEGEEWDVYEISEKSYIEDILLKNKERQEVEYISCMQTPIESIQDAIKRVCEAVPMYLSFQDDNVAADDIRRWDRGEHRKEKTVTDSDSSIHDNITLEQLFNLLLQTNRFDSAKCVIYDDSKALRAGVTVGYIKGYITSGKLAEVSNSQRLFERQVVKFKVKGFLKNRLEITIK